MNRRPKHTARKLQLRELSVKKAKPKDRAYLIWDAILVTRIPSASPMHA